MKDQDINQITENAGIHYLMFGNRLVFGFTDDYMTQLTVPSRRSSRRLNYKSKIKAKRQTKLQVPVARMLMFK